MSWLTQQSILVTFSCINFQKMFYERPDDGLDLAHRPENIKTIESLFISYSWQCFIMDRYFTSIFMFCIRFCVWFFSLFVMFYNLCGTNLKKRSGGGALKKWKCSLDIEKKNTFIICENIDSSQWLDKTWLCILAQH